MRISAKRMDKKYLKYSGRFQKEAAVCLVMLAVIAVIVIIGGLRQKSYRQAAAITSVPSIDNADIIKAYNGLAEVDPEKQIITFTLTKPFPDRLSFKVSLKPGERLIAEGKNSYIGGDEKNYYIIDPYVPEENYKVAVAGTGGTTSYDIQLNSPVLAEKIPPDITNEDIIAAANGQVYVDEINKKIIFSLQGIHDTAANFMINLNRGEQLSTDSKNAYISGHDKNYYVMKPVVIGAEYSVTISNPYEEQVYEVVVNLN